jgi:hypothetical protein
MKIKIILGVLVLLVVLLAIALVVVGTHLGDLVKAGMERVGPKLTQTTLTVDQVNLSLLAGSAGVKGLVLGNPKGYQALQSISISNAAISLAPGSVLSDKIVIHSIELRALEVTFEGNPLGANNLATIMAHVNSMTGPVNQASTNPPAASPGGQKKPAKKLEVDDFIIAGAQVHANLTGLVNKELTLPLPEIHLTDLGKGTDGITAADLTQKVLSQITAATVAALVQNAANLGQDALKTARGAASGLLQNSSNGVGESVNKLKKGLGGLLGN